MKNTIKTIISMILVVILLIGMIPNVNAELTPEYIDVKPTDWFYNDVESLRTTMVKSYGQYVPIMGGIEKGIFAPRRHTTRAMAITVLWRLACCPTPKSNTVPFNDVKKGAYYYDALRWAYENHIAEGVTKTAFQPDQLLTREQMVTFIYRYVQWGHKNQSGESGRIWYPMGNDSIYVTDKSNIFIDTNKVSDYAQIPMAWATTTKILQGTPYKKTTVESVEHDKALATIGSYKLGVGYILKNTGYTYYWSYQTNKTVPKFTHGAYETCKINPQYYITRAEFAAMANRVMKKYRVEG